MSVKKTMGGISVVNNPTFNPVDITISGNFGRKFSIISGKTPHPAVAQYSTTTGMFSKLGMAGDKLGKFRKMVLGSRVKTGFGAIQIMRGIIDKSRGEIDGQPLRLYMYNPAFDANYVVKVANAKYFQSRGTNMIWNYDLQIKGVAPLDVMARDSRVRLAASVGFNLLSKTATQTLDAVNNLMGAS
ncbi:hypothetical protein EOM86_02965 [Candidatus Nomurabacteria bacterium]|nr:hypothetical protein [Candidatus Nomurabacteria bacterium]